MFQKIVGNSATVGTGRFRQKLIRICALISLSLLLIYTVSFTDFQDKIHQSPISWNISLFLKNAVYEFQKATKQQNIHRKRKLVLLWTDYFTESDWLPSTVDLQCPVTECDITSNHSMLHSSSAVILHWRNVDLSKLPECVPSDDVQCPVWVLFNKEAPPHTSRDIMEVIQDKIHWTVTYRKDSDVYAPYGKIMPKKMRSSVKSDFDANRRLLCWLVSNCNTPSKREAFVSELEDYIEVDIYGKCGSMQCPHRSVYDCYHWLSGKCMFYLSLENSICRDYTTEKLYSALSTDMVPVVLGNSSIYDHLPPHSVINAADFSSPKELAEYLVKVGKDANLYASYFSWKRDYEVKDQSYFWFCDLCRKLHDTKLAKVKRGRNLVSWWFDESRCASWIKM